MRWLILAMLATAGLLGMSPWLLVGAVAPRMRRASA